jgi:hypothetical protein
MRTITVSVFALVASVIVPASAVAQMKWTDQAYATLSVGGQAGSHTLTTQTPFDLYEETGTLTTSQKVGGGAFVDIGGGYKVWRNLVVALTFSHTGSSSDVGVAAQVPDPVFSDHLRPATATLSDAKHSENVVHINAVWMVPVTDKIEVGVLAGPSVLMIKQGLSSGVTVTEPAPTVNNVTSTTAKKTTGGFDLGVDVTYLLTKKIGAGLLARYTVGSVKLPDATKSLTVGGFQFGVGARYRF